MEKPICPDCGVNECNKKGTDSEGNPKFKPTCKSCRKVRRAKGWYDHMEPGEPGAKKLNKSIEHELFKSNSVRGLLKRM